MSVLYSEESVSWVGALAGWVLTENEQDGRKVGQTRERVRSSAAEREVVSGTNSEGQSTGYGGGREALLCTPRNQTLLNAHCYDLHHLGQDQRQRSTSLVTRLKYEYSTSATTYCTV